MGEKILIVDDDEDLRKTVAILFASRCEVLVAGDGPAALNILRRERPRLALLDLAMPGMDGLEVLRKALRTDARLPVLMLTSETDIETARRAIELGACAYITKPFQLERLRAEVLRLLEPPPPPPEPSDRPWRVVE